MLMVRAANAPVILLGPLVFTIPPLPSFLDLPQWPPEMDGARHRTQCYSERVVLLF